MRLGFIYFAKPHLKIFIGSFIAVFLIVALQQLGIHAPKFLNPLSETKPSVFEEIRGKLFEKPQSFHLKYPQSLIAEAHATGEYDQAHAYAVFNLDTGEVYAEKNRETILAIASITKIMSAIVTLDLMKPEEEIRITRYASSQIPTKIGVVAGEYMTVEELLHATLLTSANDAAQALMDGVDEKYGDSVFIWAMNEKANYLGLTKTHFDNPQGFDGDNYSSVEDLSVLTQYALSRYPLFAEIVKRDYLYLPENMSHKQFDLYNWNGLIGVYPDTFGVKIGNTEKAGKTTVVAAERGGKRIGVVLLGAPTLVKRDLWAAELLDVGFEKAGNMERIAITEEQLQEKYATWQYQ